MHTAFRERLHDSFLGSRCGPHSVIGASWREGEGIGEQTRVIIIGRDAFRGNCSEVIELSRIRRVNWMAYTARNAGGSQEGPVHNAIQSFCYLECLAKFPCSASLALTLRLEVWKRCIWNMTRCNSLVQISP